MSNKNIVNLDSLESLSVVVSFVSGVLLYFLGCGQLAEFFNQEHGIPLILSWGVSFSIGLLFLAVPLWFFMYLLRAILMYVFYPFYWIAGHFNTENK